MKKYFNHSDALKSPKDHTMRVKGSIPHVHPFMTKGQIRMCETQLRADGSWPEFCSCGAMLIDAR